MASSHIRQIIFKLIPILFHQRLNRPSPCHKPWWQATAHVIKSIGHPENPFGDAYTKHLINKLLWEMVAVVGENVVTSTGELSRQLFQ